MKQQPSELWAPSGCLSSYLYRHVSAYFYIQRTQRDIVVHVEPDFWPPSATFTLLVAISFVHQRPRITSVGKVCLHPSVLAGNSCLWSLNPGMPCLLCGLFENPPAGFQHHERQNNVFPNHRAPRRLSTPPLGLIWRFYWILLKLPWASLRVIGEPLTPTVCLAPPLQVFSPGPSKVEI